MNLPSGSEVLPFPPLEPLPARWSRALSDDDADEDGDATEEAPSPAVPSRDLPPSHGHDELALQAQTRCHDAEALRKGSHSSGRLVYFESSVRRAEHRSNSPRSELSSRIRSMPYSRPSSRCYAPRSQDVSSESMKFAGRRTSFYDQRDRDGLHLSRECDKSRCRRSGVYVESQCLKCTKDKEFCRGTHRKRRYGIEADSYNGTKRRRDSRSLDVYASRRTRTRGTCFEKIDSSEAYADKRINHRASSMWAGRRGMKASSIQCNSKNQLNTSLDHSNLDTSSPMDQDLELTAPSNGALFCSGFCEPISTEDIGFQIKTSINSNGTFSSNDMPALSESKPFRNDTLKQRINKSANENEFLKCTKLETSNTGDCKANCDELKLSVGSQETLTGDTNRSEYSEKKPTPRSKDIPTTFVDVTNKFHIRSTPVVKKQAQEEDAHRLGQRQRQIDFGKNTLGYERYCDLISRQNRKRSDPQTPNPKQVCSKRSWDGQIRKWRRLLHAYDPPIEEGEELAEDFSKFYSKSSNMTENDNQGISEAEGVTNGENQKGGIKDISLEIYEDWMEP